MKHPQLFYYKFQYYHKDDKCRANGSTAPDCICWYDEGTGPNSEATHDGDSCLTWRQVQVPAESLAVEAKTGVVASSAAGELVGTEVMVVDPTDSLLEAILAYYDRTKGVGHTKSLMSGIGFINGGAVRPTVVVGNKLHGVALNSDSHVLISDFGKWSAGKRKPLIWDNQAIYMVIGAALQRIEVLKEAFKDQEWVAQSEAAQAKALNDENCDLHRQLEKSNDEIKRLEGALVQTGFSRRMLADIVFRLKLRSRVQNLVIDRLSRQGTKTYKGKPKWGARATKNRLPRR